MHDEPEGWQQSATVSAHPASQLVYSVPMDFLRDDAMLWCRIAGGQKWCIGFMRFLNLLVASSEPRHRTENHAFYFS